MDVDTGQFTALTATAERVAELERELADVQAGRMDAILFAARVAFDAGRDSVLNPRTSPPLPRRRHLRLVPDGGVS